MKRSCFLTRLAVVVTLLLLAAAPGSESSAENKAAVFEAVLREARAKLNAWKYREAEQLSRQLLQMVEDPALSDSARSRAYLFRASYFYYLGDYSSCRQELEKMSDVTAANEAMPRLYERAKKLEDVWAGAKEVRSEHFILRLQPGKDEVLIEPALETLEKAYAALSADFGIAPEEPVLVEIYPDFEGFQAATNLSAEDLENSGTIAVCKYRRLMINSPRNLMAGYNYRDTLSHEFVHFLVYLKYGEAIPIWLHEGLAKFQEKRWRQEQGGELEPTLKSLLASALRQNEFISFERMSPSFAYLKTPTQGQLAFAQVSMVVSYLLQRGGWDLIFRLGDEIVLHQDYKAALRKTTGLSFERFWEDYLNYLRQQNFEEIPGVEISALEIRRGEQEFEEADEEVGEEELAEGEEWRYVRLGDLLRDRGHYAAALVEYERARQLVPYSPRLLNKIGLCHYLAGNFAAGKEPLKQVLQIYPYHVNTFINLGRIYYAEDKKEEAAEFFRRALDINPFNPLPYNYLIKIAEEKGDLAQAESLTKNLRLISGPPPPAKEKKGK